MKNATLSLLVCTLLLAAVPALGANYGKPLSDGPIVKISELLAKPDAYVGKTVKVEGIITDVCEKRGCWMMIASDQEFQAIRFKVEDGVIVFPIESKGRKAVAEGTFKRIELTKEQAIAQAKHHAEEHGLSFDPATVTGPSVAYQLDGHGAVID
jgi:hypothetical protein